MAMQTTINSAKAFSPDITAFMPDDAIPDALILKGSTVVTKQLEGDDPVARIPWVGDDEADFILEGQEIPQGDPELNEVFVPTRKVAKLLSISREQYNQDQTAGLLSNSAQRAVTKRANRAFLANPLPADGAQFPAPTGLINTEGIIDGGSITTNLDAVADAIAQIEDNEGTPSVMFVNPLAWGRISNLKTAEDENSSLVGAGTHAAERMLNGIPVITSPYVPDGQLVIVDPTAIAAAVGNIQVATNDSIYFASDAIAIRVTWRMGWAVQHPSRMATVAVAGPGF